MFCWLYFCFCLQTVSELLPKELPLTNAVRYAEATELYADFSETETEASVTLTNNGKLPEGEIAEGGGLSSLRKRVERAGGQMIVQSLPAFRLTVTIPKGKEDII